jgi:predicted nucleic acid-binding protein
VTESRVVDASPFIFLANAGVLELLRSGCSRVVLPAAVVAEIRNVDPPDPAAAALDEVSWIDLVEDLPIPELVQLWGLDPGESSVLAWAGANPGAEAVIDDREARRCAATLGILVRGTLGLVVQAKRRGAIPSAPAIIDRPRAAGMYLSDQVVREALSLIGEA